MAVNARMQQHDNEAIPLVIEAFRQYGFTGGAFGAETDNERMHEQLLKLSDPTSIMLRFRPDRYLSHTEYRSVIVEVKSESQGYPNFAIEELSYRAMLEWNREYQHVMVAAVSLHQKPMLTTITPHDRISACWAHNLPMPTRFILPNRWDRPKHTQRLLQEWPGIPHQLTERYGGSGTPYFLVAKADACWRPITTFIEQELLSKTSPVYLPAIITHERTHVDTSTPLIQKLEDFLVRQEARDERIESIVEALAHKVTATQRDNFTYQQRESTLIKMLKQKP